MFSENKSKILALLRLTPAAQQTSSLKLSKHKDCYRSPCFLYFIRMKFWGDMEIQLKTLRHAAISN